VTLGTYDPATGLTGNATATFSIELTPAAAPRTCTLHVFTTDRAHPDVVVTITAQ
jgi:hypothetical protein